MSPQVVLAAGGVVLLAAQLGIRPTIFGDSRILATVVLYVVLFGVTWLLLKKVLLEAILKVPR